MMLLSFWATAAGICFSLFDIFHLQEIERQNWGLETRTVPDHACCTISAVTHGVSIMQKASNEALVQLVSAFLRPSHVPIISRKRKSFRLVAQKPVPSLANPRR